MKKTYLMMVCFLLLQTMSYGQAPKFYLDFEGASPLSSLPSGVTNVDGANTVRVKNTTDYPAIPNAVQSDGGSGNELFLDFQGYLKVNVPNPSNGFTLAYDYKRNWANDDWWLGFLSFIGNDGTNNRLEQIQIKEWSGQLNFGGQDSFNPYPIWFDTDYKIVITCSASGDINLYVDNVLKLSVPNATSGKNIHTWTNASLLLSFKGSSFDGTNVTPEGDYASNARDVRAFVDNVALFERELSPSEVSYINTNGNNTNPTPIVVQGAKFYLDFEGASPLSNLPSGVANVNSTNTVRVKNTTDFPAIPNAVQSKSTGGNELFLDFHGYLKTDIPDPSKGFTLAYDYRRTWDNDDWWLGFLTFIGNDGSSNRLEQLLIKEWSGQLNFSGVDSFNPYPVYLDQNYKIVITCSAGGDIKVYVDNVLKLTVPNATSGKNIHTWTNASLLLSFKGSSFDGITVTPEGDYASNSRDTRAFVDNIALFEMELSAADVAQLYNNGNNTFGVIAQPTYNYYADADGDGYGAGSVVVLYASTAPTGYSTNNTDCDDAAVLYADVDGDGFGSMTVKVACSGVTNNTDCDDTTVLFEDVDGDGYGSTVKVACGGVTTNTDCAPNNPAINPGATEVFDTIDNDCDGLTDEGVTLPAPVVANTGICKGTVGATPSALALPGYSLVWYKDGTTTTALPSAPVITATKTFFVAQRLGAGAISPRASVTTTVNLLPTTPAVALTIGTEVIKKVGNLIGTSTALTLTATPVGAVPTASYNWTLPGGVNQTAGGSTGAITINFNGVTPGITAIDLFVSSVSAEGCISKTARKLTVTRALPAKPKALVLTDALRPDLLKITKLGEYTGALNTRTLTLTATPITKQGSQATSYKWVLPAAAVTTTATPVVGEANTYTSSSNVISINLSNVSLPIAESSFLFQVYAVNGNGTSLLSTNLTCTSAAPKTPAIVASSTIFNTCSTRTYTATDILGATYNWTIPNGASIVGSSTGNVIVVSFTGVTTAATYAVTCSASNGNGTGFKSLTIKRAATCAKIAPEEVVAEDELSAVAYPNPSSSEFTIEASRKGASVKVYDMTGRLIENRQATSTSVQVGRNFASGIYNVIVSQGAKAKTLKVIKR